MDEDKKKKLELLRGLEKLKMSPVKSEGYTSPLDQDTMRVRGGSASSEPVTRIKNATDIIDTKQIQKLTPPGSFQSKIQALLKNNAAKKALGILPMAGTVAGLMSGDPAMAAEEAAGDLVPGLEAIKSGDAGESEEEERMMLAEDQARKNYAQSPARAAKLAYSAGQSPSERALSALRGHETASSPEEVSAQSQPSSSPNKYFSKLANSMRSQFGDKASEGLASDRIPSQEAQGLQADEIAPEMQDSLQRSTEELSPEAMRAERLRRLMNLKG